MLSSGFRTSVACCAGIVVLLVLTVKSNAQKRPTNLEDFSSWLEIAPASNAFSIGFPQLPVHNSSSTVEGYLVEYQDVLFVLNIGGLMAEEDKTSGRTRVKLRDFVVGRCLVRESLDYPSGANRNGWYSRNRLLDTPTRRYSWGIVSSDRDFLFSKAANHFFDSFKLNKGCDDSSSATPLSPRGIAQTAFPSVVLLEMTNESAHEISQGSGFFVAPNLIATNYHVTSGTSKGYAKLVGQSTKYEVSGVAAEDKVHDLVLLKVNNANALWLPLTTSPPAVGDEIYAIGNPEGLEGTFSQGIVSGVRRLTNGTLIQITAPISHGSSGGPILNSSGRVVGIAAAGMKEGQNLNFAIPASYLATLLSRAVGFGGVGPGPGKL